MSSIGIQSQRIGASPITRAWKYEGWARGENSFAEDNEIRDNEFYEGNDIEVYGKSSVRMGRRGSREFATVTGATKLNGWGVYKDPVARTNFLIAQASGHLYKITTSGVVSEIDPTKTWDVDAKMRGILLRGYFYFGNGIDYMAKTDGTTITRWTAVTAITGLTVALTGSGSAMAYAYSITAVTDNGESESCAEFDIMGPDTLDNTNKFTVTWNRKTDAVVKGYNVYKTESGGTLTLLTFIDQQSVGATMSYVDDGTETRSALYEAPDYNTTGGVIGNIFAKYANTLFVSGNPDEPDTVFYGGTGSNWESFSPSDNGGWIQPGRGDGERVTAMIGFEDFLFIFKENSIWKFVFGSDGGPSLISVIPQYGTSSPDTVWRMEKEIVYLGTDGRYRILGYEPTQLNVIRTADISNRIQYKLDAIDKSVPENLFATFFDQKFIVCNGSVAYPYDRRYTAFLGTWRNYSYDRFIIWDAGTGNQKLYGFRTGTGRIDQLLVDGTWDDNGTTINASLRVKRIDGGEDGVIKTFLYSQTKIKEPVGKLTLVTYRDGQDLVDDIGITFPSNGGVGEYMLDEAMLDETEDTLVATNDTIRLIKKELYFEAFSIYHQIMVGANAYNHCIVQTMSGELEFEDPDYDDGKTVITR